MPDTQAKADQTSSVTYWRSLFVSDLHMGSSRFDADAFIKFLKSTESEFLYIVGDMLDGWKLEQRWYWPNSYNRVLEELLRKRHAGTKIFLISGNHDETLRNLSHRRKQMFARDFGIPIIDQMLHHTADGRRFLLLHGDQFDRALLRGRFARFGDRIYDWIVRKLRVSKGPYIQIDGTWKRFSLAKMIKRSGQWALLTLNNFEKAIERRARQAHADGIICGHTHIPFLKDKNKLKLGNCGSWVTGRHSAIGETATGEMKLLFWPEDIVVGNAKPTTRASAEARNFSFAAHQLATLVGRIWQPDFKKSDLFKEGLDIDLKHVDDQHLLRVNPVTVSKVPIKTEDPDIKVFDELGFDGFEFSFKTPLALEKLQGAARKLKDRNDKENDDKN